MTDVSLQKWTAQSGLIILEHWLLVFLPRSRESLKCLNLVKILRDDVKSLFCGGDHHDPWCKTSNNRKEELILAPQGVVPPTRLVTYYTATIRHPPHHWRHRVETGPTICVQPFNCLVSSSLLGNLLANLQLELHWRDKVMILLEALFLTLKLKSYQQSWEKMYGPRKISNMLIF